MSVKHIGIGRFGGSGGLHGSSANRARRPYKRNLGLPLRAVLTGVGEKREPKIAAHFLDASNPVHEVFRAVVVFVDRQVYERSLHGGVSPARVCFSCVSPVMGKKQAQDAQSTRNVAFVQFHDSALTKRDRHGLQIVKAVSP